MFSYDISLRLQAYEFPPECIKQYSLLLLGNNFIIYSFSDHRMITSLFVVKYFTPGFHIARKNVYTVETYIMLSYVAFSCGKHGLPHFLNYWENNVIMLYISQASCIL